MLRTRHSTVDLGLFQDSDFAGYLEDSKSTSGGVLCIFGSRTFVPVSWMCKKQTSVSHRSRRVWYYFSGCWTTYGGYLLLTCWTLWSRCFVQPRTTFNLVTLAEGNLGRSNPTIPAQGNLSMFNPTPDNLWFQNQDQNVSIENRGLINWTKWIAYPPTHVLLKVNLSCTSLKKTKPWFQMIVKGRSPTLRQVSSGCLVGSTWIQKSKSNMLTPKTNLLTF